MNGYAAASMLAPSDEGRSLLLETAVGLTPVGLREHPAFFSGLVVRPEVMAAGLLAVADVAATTYYDLSMLRASLDPVVTAGGDRLRFESFSRCNGVYARFDLLESGIASGEIGLGTTNVDINQELRTHLASVHATELVHVAVGADRLEVSTPDQTHVEREVDLPDRWVRGLAAVPSISTGMEQVAELTPAASMPFLAGLPRSAPGPSLNLMRSTRGLLPAATAASADVRLAGTARLSTARRFMRFITRTRVYRHDSGASGWVFDLDGARVTLVITAEPYRGFSGEGSALHDLSAVVEADLERVREQLAWQSVIDPAALATDLQLSEQRVRSALAALGTSGRIGFDLADQAWFHRELPIDADRLARDNPRLSRARELVDRGRVTSEGDTWTVETTTGTRWVRPEGERLVCTCPWQARYDGRRGPCSHVLAVELVRAG
ncbi:SWIM zinc finger family protein [Microbacterium sp. 2FI]|uniref:SWIM zinc finger family protein n=1 Tax=Microbacterium sp. 2FI TaxID=2502193 RepID=UPI0010F612BD|nr:SWIM zinc finger family protein [Microbacterium sp. 2FI]